MILFTPLSGAHNEGPLCYLLELDEFKFLLDCGWTDTFDVSQFDELKKVAEDIDAVLISHPDMAHLGGLPYAVGKLGLNAPIYATLPTQRMGEMFMYDIHTNKADRENFSLFSLDDIDLAFEHFVQLKYFQRFRMEGKGRGITVTPVPAGHMIGGAAWRISKETDEIIYAVDFHHRKERILPSIEPSIFGKPTVTITDAYNATRPPQPKNRDLLLRDAVLQTLRADGSVLIPCDTAGRVFELMVFLDAHWRQYQIQTYQIVVLSNTSHRTVEFARGMLEWMNDGVHRSFDDNRRHPLRFPNFHFIHTLEELEKLRAERKPMVVLTTPSSLNTGFSLELITQWARTDKNTIIFIDKGAEGSIARQIIDEVYTKSQERAKGINTGPPLVTVDMPRKVPIEGDELREWEELEKKRLEEEQEKEREEVKKRRVIKIKDDEVEMMDELTVPELEAPEASNPRLFLPSSFVYTSPHLMFPCREANPPILEPYGTPIDPQLLETIQGKQLAQQQQLQEQFPTMSLMSLPAYPSKKEGGRRAVPMKPKIETVVIAIYCRVEIFDFEGLVDGASLKNMLSDRRMFNTKHLILVHGSNANTEHLKQFCAEKEVGSAVHAPRIGERIDVSNDTQMYKIKLKNELFTRLKFEQANDSHIAFIEGEVMYPQAATSGGPTAAMDAMMDIDPVECPTEAEAHRKRRAINLNLPDRELPVLADIPAATGGGPANAKGHATVLIGDITLSRFAHVLLTRGYQTEFKDGCLVCNGKVVLRMRRDGDISIEGMLCDEYFAVRDLLYQQYKVV